MTGTTPGNRANPAAVAIDAPHAAPPETPRMNGSASGLRSSVWNVTPATASVAPTSAASSARGSRIPMRIARAVASPDIAARQETFVAPADDASRSAMTSSSASSATAPIRSLLLVCRGHGAQCSVSDARRVRERRVDVVAGQRRIGIQNLLLDAGARFSMMLNPDAVPRMHGFPKQIFGSIAIL